MVTLLVLFLLAVCAAGASPAGAAAAAQRNPFRTGRTLVIAHGGGDALFPENTLEAYEGSSVLGGEVIDVDLAMSADGVLVAFHDATLERTTDGTGRLASRTFAELSGLDAGFDFVRAGKRPFRAKNVRIPSLESILLRFPSTPVTLDVKDERVALVAPLCTRLAKLGRVSDVFVGTDSTAQVQGLRSACPGVPTSSTGAERRAMRAARDARDPRFVATTLVSQPPYRAADGTLRITKAYLDYAHSKGIAVLTWVVDDPTDMRSLIRMGVDGIYTRRPDILREVLWSVKGPA